MKLENTFSVPVPVEETWRVLLDVERIAPCVPGATLESNEGDSYRGKVKVKLGPIGLTYGGTVTFVSRDEAAKVAVLEASGREARGGGTAKAVVTCRLSGSGDSTDVLVETDLAITGKPAQFGRGTLAEVSGSLIGKFAANLAEEITRTDTETAEPAADSTSAAPATDSSDSGDQTPAATAPPAEPAAAADKSAEPINLIEAAGGSLRRFGAAAAGTILLVIVAIVWWRYG